MSLKLSNPLAIKFIRFTGFLLLVFLSFQAANSQTINYTKGALNIDVFVSNPCGGGPSNGFMKFTVNAATGGSSGSVNIQIFGPPSQASPVTVNVGGTFTFNAGKTLPALTYNLLIIDNNGPDIINTFSGDPPVVLTALPAITISGAAGNNLANTSCTAPNGKVGFNLAGGSLVLSGGGSFNYTITSSNAVVGFPLSGTYNGTTTLDITTLLNASNPPITGLPGGTYSVSITDNYSVCGATMNWTVTDPSPLLFNTTAATPNVCLGQTGTVQLSGSETNVVVYRIYENGSPTAITLNGNSGLLNFTIPAALLTPVGSYNFTILATNGVCTPAFMNLTATIVVNPLPVPTITGPTPVCVGSTGSSYVTETGKSAYTWSVTGGTITSGAGTNTILVTWTTSGAESVSVNYTDANGCTAASPTSKAITVNPTPIPTITGLSSVCIGATGVTYVTETGKSGYLWSVSGGTITAGSGTNTVTVTWNTAGAQNVSVNYTDANGCTAPSPTVKPVTVNALPVPVIAGSSSVCLNSSSNYSTAVGNSAYVWTVSPGGTITAGAGTSSITINWTTTGVKTVSVSYTDANGCSAASPSNLSVTVNPLPTPTITGPSSVCAGTTGVIYNTEVANTGYTWTVSAGGTITAGAGTSSITVTWNTAGPQSVSVNYTNANGCTAPSPTVSTITVNPLPAPTITGLASVCAGASGVTYTTEVGKIGYIWGVTGGTITAGTGTSSITVTWNTVGAQSVTINYTDVNGCTASAPTNKVVTVNALPTPTVTGNSLVCLNSTGNIYSTETGDSGYLWTVTGGTITAGAGTNSITVTWTTSGTQMVSVNYSNANGCSAASPTTESVAVKTATVPTITGPSSVCDGSTGVTYVTETGETAYVWGVTGGTITSGAGTNSITVTWTSAGTQTVSVSYTNSSGCTPASPTVQTVNVNTLPIPVITGPGAVCVNSAASYNTTAGNTGYTWTVSAGGTITSGAGTNIIAVSWTGAGAQTVGVSYTDANGCTPLVPTSKTVTVNSPPVPVITGPANACANSTGNVYSTAPGNTSYAWTISSGGTIVSGAATNSITVTWTTAGPQNVNVNYTDLNGCTAVGPSSEAVTVNPSPSPTITGGNSFCPGSSATYFTEAGNSGYAWTVTGGTITSGTGTNTIVVTWNTSGAQTVSVNYTDVNGCSAAFPSSLNVTISPLATAAISGTTNICVGRSASLSVALTGVAPWSVVYTDGTSNFTINGIASSPATFTVSPIISTTYSLVSVTDSGCGAGTVSGTASVTVNPIPGNPATYGNNTWIGYVYDDSGDPSPLPGRINFSPSKYRGFVDQTDMASLSPFCSYTNGTNIFTVDLSNTYAMQGPNVCGSYNDNFSVKYRMNMTFPAGVYTFTVGSDDGVALLIDGVNVITNPSAFTAHAYTVYSSAPQCITAGAHDFDIEYFQVFGFSKLTFSYSAAAPPTVSPSPATICVNSTAPTLTASSSDPTVTGFAWYSDAALTNQVSTSATFTPSSAQLNTTVAGTTSFYAVATYSCGQSASAQDDITVLNSAAINLPTSPTQVCQTGGIIDLTTLVSATPAGGSFAFSGTGVTTSPSFDPTLVSGSSLISVMYTSGTCSASASFTLGVTTTATITVPSSTISTCQTSGTVDLTTLVSATPVGGTFTFTGSGVTGTLFDPSAQSGAVAVTVNYNAGGCTNSNTINFNVTSNAVLTPTNKTVCPSSGLLDLTTLVTAVPAGGTFTFTGTGVTGNNFDPSGSAGTAVNVSVAYSQAGCTATGTIVVTVLTAGNPLCGGSTGVNCNVFTVQITDTRPTCLNQNDGSITFTVSGGTPDYILTLFDGGSFTQALPGPGPTFTFSNLSPDAYQYTLQDAGGNTCTLPYSLLTQSTVMATASDFSNANCVDQEGQATLTVVSGGTPPYQYSVDAGVTWITFTSPTNISLMPSPSPYSILVRNDSLDQCPAQVTVTVNGPTASLDTLYVKRTISFPDQGSGTMLIGIKESGYPPYDVKLVLVTPRFPNQIYSLDWTAAARNPQDLNIEYDAKNLYAGVYTLSIRDSLGCEKDYSVTINLDNSVFIPNVFTPNGDSYNDVFYIRNLPTSGTYVLITNRWGQEVYKSSNYQNDWSGGNESAGVYYYRIKISGQVYTGWLEIIRD